jgi:hypothetical protein
MSDRPAGVKATRSPWTDGAWIMQETSVPEGWEWRFDPDGVFTVERSLRRFLVTDGIVEARPVRAS